MSDFPTYKVLLVGARSRFEVGDVIATAYAEEQ
jgi:hypothetical protein